MLQAQAKDFGVTERDIQNRKQTEAAHQTSVEDVLEQVVSDIKETNDWKVVPFSKLSKQHKLKQANDRQTILYELQAHENIISRPASNLVNHEKDQISATIPLEYKYVPKEEKEKLGFDANCFRKLYGSRLEAIKEIFGDTKPKNNYVDILAIVELLYSRGAVQGWVPLETLKVSGLTSVPIENVLSVLEELGGRHFLVVAKAMVGKKNRPVVQFAASEERYQELLKQKEDQNITLFEIQKKTRSKRKAVVDAAMDKMQDLYAERDAAKEGVTRSVKYEAPTTGEQQLVIKRIINNVAAAEQHAKGDFVSVNGMRQKSSKDFTIKDICDTIGCDVSKSLEKMVSSYVGTAVSRYQEAMKQNSNILAKVMQERNQYRKDLEAEAALVIKYKKQIDSLVKYNNGFVANTQDAMNLFVGQFISLLEDFSKLKRFQLNDQVVVAGYKKKAFDLIGDTSQKITQYKPDRYPPDLKR